MADLEHPRPAIAGRRVLITGAASGIGLASARALAADGARLALVSRGDEALGGLDAVVANAGAAAYEPFTEMEPAEYLRTVDITLSGALNIAHASLPHLRRTHGTLVFVGSVAGRVAVPWLAAYTAAKHGVRGFARSLRAELRALERPRIERTVGGLMAAWVLFDALAPRAALRLTGTGARLGWRRRERRPVDGTDALAGPVGSADVGGGLPGRPSVLRRLRDRTLTP